MSRKDFFHEVFGLKSKYYTIGISIIGYCIGSLTMVDRSIIGYRVFDVKVVDMLVNTEMCEK